MFLTILIVLFAIGLLLAIKPTRGLIVGLLSGLGVLGFILLWLLVALCSAAMPVFIIWAVGHYGLHWW